MTIMPSLAKGALAGLIGTAAMTATQLTEMRVTGREPSLVPGHVASKLLGLSPEGDEALSRISIRMHWAHGMTMGTIRALLGRAGLGGPGAATAHFALMWSGDVVLYKGTRDRRLAVALEPRRAGSGFAPQGHLRSGDERRV